MSVLTPFEPLFRDPFFRELDRLSGSLGGRRGPATLMPVDVYRHGDELVATFDLPGIDPESVEVTVDKNVLSVTAERSWTPEADDQVLVSERPQGRYARRLHLGDNLDTEAIDARYDRGVLSLRIPVSAQAQPRRIQVSTGAPAPLTPDAESTAVPSPEGAGSVEG